MKNTIYVDVLVLINMYVGYFLFVSTKKLINASVNHWRMIIGCLASGLSSLVILLDMNFVELLVVKILMCTSLSLIVFYKKNQWKFFVKATLMFFGVSCLFGGLMLCIWYFITPASMQFKNGIVYFNISALTLAISTIIAYVTITIFCYILDKRNASNDLYTVTLTFQGREIALNALLDTGNKLVDIFTGLPVMICELKEFQSFLPTKLYDFMQSPNQNIENVNTEYLAKNKLRIIPINAVSGSSSLMAFKPDKTIVCKGDFKKECNVLVAVTNETLSDGTFKALICQAML